MGEKVTQVKKIWKENPERVFLVENKSKLIYFKLNYYVDKPVSTLRPKSHRQVVTFSSNSSNFQVIPGTLRYSRDILDHMLNQEEKRKSLEPSPSKEK